MNLSRQHATDKPIRPTTSHPIQLAELVASLPGVEQVSGKLDRPVTDISVDSRSVGQDCLYVALEGAKTHGANFVQQAISAQAAGVLTDAKGAQIIADSIGDFPLVVCEDARLASAIAAGQIFGNPANSLNMIGITGTNGKTTTTFLIESALNQAGRKVGSIGTMGFRLCQNPIESKRTTVTTPESSDLQALLAVMVERGATDLVMEVSSHALKLNRVAGIRYRVAAFINLGRDHLDFHPDLTDYFESKAKLFTQKYSQQQVINIDDPFGKVLAERVFEETGHKPITTGFAAEADYQILAWELNDAGGCDISLKTPSGELSFDIDLPGEFNVRNAVTALAVGQALGYSASQLLPGIKIAQVPGRMQRVYLEPDQSGNAAPRVYVDFAHTPQAIASALAAIKTSGKLIAVFGAGGDRDPLKREPMGEAGANNADLVIVTDDNPRSERPEAIRAKVLAGALAAVKSGARASEAVDGGDRMSAIELAFSKAAPGDVIALLGKGHETGQIVGEQILPFEDVSAVKQAWQKISSANYSTSS